MFYTPASSFNQADRGKRLNKKFNLASLPAIDPCLISTALAIPRLIDELEDVFNQIAVAANNGDKEFTVPRRLGGSYYKRHTWYREVRLELIEAFDLLMRPIMTNLEHGVRRWYSKVTQATSISSTYILESKFGVDPPIEIKQAVQALNLAFVKRALLTDMLEQAEGRRCGMATAN